MEFLKREPGTQVFPIVDLLRIFGEYGEAREKLMLKLRGNPGADGLLFMAESIRYDVEFSSYVDEVKKLAETNPMDAWLTEPVDRDRAYESGASNFGEMFEGDL